MDRSVHPPVGERRQGTDVPYCYILKDAPSDPTCLGLLSNFQSNLIEINRLHQREVEADSAIQKASFDDVADGKVCRRKPPFSKVAVFLFLPIG